MLIEFSFLFVRGFRGYVRGLVLGRRVFFFVVIGGEKRMLGIGGFVNFIINKLRIFYIRSKLVC